MRWLLLLLLVLNVFYYVWHQQRVPVDAPDNFRASTMNIASRADPIQLVDESGAGNLSTESSSPELSTESCMFLGSFEKEAQARVLQQRLLSLDLPASPVQLETGVGLDYWVYFAPLASRQASLRQLRELQARDVDSYIITQGELVNGLSLGIFSSEEQAATLIGRLHELGYQPQLKELPRKHRMFWVRIAPEGLRLMAPELLERLKGDFSNLRSELKPCNSIALGD